MWFRPFLPALPTWLVAVPPGLLALAVVGVVFGLPAADWALWRDDTRLSLACLLAWLGAAAPVTATVTAWGWKEPTGTHFIFRDSGAAVR